MNNLDPVFPLIGFDKTNGETNPGCLGPCRNPDGGEILINLIMINKSNANQ